MIEEGCGVRLSEWMAQFERRVAPGLEVLDAGLSYLRPDLEVEAHVVDVRLQQNRVTSRHFMLLTQDHLIHGITFRDPEHEAEAHSGPESYMLTTVSYPLKHIVQLASVVSGYGHGLSIIFTFSADCNLGPLTLPPQGVELEREAALDYLKLAQQLARRLI